MRLTRRGFVRTAGLGTAGALSTSFIIGRGSEAAAFETALLQEPFDDGILKISSNENARGPGSSVMRAIQDAATVRMGRGYPPDYTNDFVTTIAETYGVARDNVVVSTGSGAILEAATRAFCSPAAPLVTGSPSYGSPAGTAQRIGAGVREIPVDASLGLDLGAMADASTGAGMVFLCNPNNPTGTAHTATDVAAFVERVKRNSPQTSILIDEAYTEYTFGSGMSTATPLTQEYPGVFVTRTFSKAHGMAGLRVGYAVGQPETIQAIRQGWGLGSMNTLSAAAAMASIRDTRHMEAERAENARVREFTLNAFREMGFEAPDTHTNFIFVKLGIPASRFREACLEQNIRVGRDFPPMQETHSRISLGTMEEMERAVAVFRRVLRDRVSLG